MYSALQTRYRWIEPRVLLCYNMYPSIRIPGKCDRRELSGLALHCRLLAPDLRFAPRASVHPVVRHALVRPLGLLVEDFPGCGGARGVFGGRRRRSNLAWLEGAALVEDNPYPKPQRND